MGNLGFKEILIIVFVVLLLFGARRIPEVMRAFGKGIREFKKAAKEIESQVEDDKDSESAKSPPPVG